MSEDYGPLSALLADTRVTGVFMTGHASLIVETTGGSTEGPSGFAGVEEYQSFLRALAAKACPESPDVAVATGIADGTKYAVVLPPVAEGEGCLSLRKWTPFFPTLENLVERDSLTAEAAAYLRGVVKAGANILVYGGSGSGKTATLRALAAEARGERPRPLAAIEEAGDLGLDGNGWQVLHPTRPGTEPEITAASLVRLAQRMGAEAIVLDEMKGDGSGAMLSAMIFGTQGLASLHAADAHSALVRMRSQAFDPRPGGFPLESVTEGVAAAVHVLVGVRRFPDGTRGVVSVEETEGVEEGDFRTRRVFWSGPGDEDGHRGTLDREAGYVTTPALAGKLRSCGLPYAAGDGLGF